MAIIFRLIGKAWRYRGRLLLAYSAFFAAVGFSLMVPQLLGEAIDTLVNVHDGVVQRSNIEKGTLLWFALGIFGATVMRGLFDFCRVYLTDSLSQKVTYDLRNEIYNKLQYLSFAFHDRQHTGDLMTRVTADVEAIRRFVMMGLVRSLEVGVRVLAILFILIFLDWELTLISLAFVPFMVARSVFVMGAMRSMWTRVQETMGESVTILQENLAGIKVVKASASENYESKKYASKVSQLRDEHFKSERIQGTESAKMTFLFTLALGAIVWYGGWEVIKGDLTPGGLTKFVMFLGQITFPIRISPFIINSFSRASSSGKRLFEILDSKSQVVEQFPDRDMGPVKGDITFKNVSFSYGQGTYALKDVNLSVKSGSLIALLGSPGSGKTSLVNLIPRFYDPTSGLITIDGRDVSHFSLASLRRNVGVVQQDVFLFWGTISENISYGVPSATDSEIIEAAKIAQLHEDILRLPDGYKTLVGERGTTLSGGQKQRLSIARTLLMDPPILILDDSTSSVDVETESSIHTAIIEVIKGRTTFVIAHRLSTVKNSDIILVMEDGLIVERGVHEDLRLKGGLYSKIYDLQLVPKDTTM